MWQRFSQDLLCPFSGLAREDLGGVEEKKQTNRERAPIRRPWLITEIPTVQPPHGSVIWGQWGTESLLKLGFPDLVHREPDTPTGFPRVLQDRQRTKRIYIDIHQRTFITGIGLCDCEGQEDPSLPSAGWTTRKPSLTRKV